jgi:hypothetical protein
MQAAKERHQRKIQDLWISDTHKEEVNKNRWVINLSKRQLSHKELTVLRNSLNFASSPKTIPIAHIVANIEKGNQIIDSCICC